MSSSCLRRISESANPDLMLFKWAAAAAIEGCPRPPCINRDAEDTGNPGGKPGIPAPGGMPKNIKMKIINNSFTKVSMYKQ